MKASKTFILGILLFVSFVFFSYLVHENLFTKFDFDTTVRLQDKLPEVWVGPFSILSLIGSFEVSSVIILITAIFIKGFRRLFVLGSYAMVMVFELFGKTFVDHKGPPFMFVKTHLPFHFPSDYIPHEFFAYPSGHSGRTAFICVTLFLLVLSSRRIGESKKMLVLALISFYAFLMFVSRVYLGEHWSSDVIGGILLGSSLGFLSLTLPSVLRNHKQ